MTYPEYQEPKRRNIKRQKLRNFMVSYIEMGLRKKFYVQAITKNDAKELSVLQGAKPDALKAAQELKFGW